MTTGHVTYMTNERSLVSELPGNEQIDCFVSIARMLPDKRSLDRYVCLISVQDNGNLE